jgi:hypothetical protein
MPGRRARPLLASPVAVDPDRDEFLLAATAQDLRKMAKLMPLGALPLAA